MVSILSDLKGYITNNFDNYETVLTDLLDDGNESICLRIEPGNPAEKRYLNGVRVGRTNFSLYCKSLSKSKAIDQLWDYINGLDLKGIPLTDNLSITTEPLTEPHFVSVNEDGAMVYTASFGMQYEYLGT